MATPQVLSRKANGAPSAATNDAPKPTKTKVPPEGEKVVVRRLPPGMTQEEFFALLGDSWKSGNGKVDWVEYCPGKITHECVIRSPSEAVAFLVLTLVFLPLFRTALPRYPGRRARIFML